MNIIKIAIAIVLLYTLSGCELTVRKFESKEQYTIQLQNFTTLSENDKFILSEFNLIEPQISHINKYTTTYYVFYNRYQWHVTVSNKTKLIKNIKRY